MPTPTLQPGDARNPRAFGAIGDGIADDTDAIQAAIDSAIDQRFAPTETTRPSLGPVHLPTGTYRITKPIRIYSVLGFRFSGDGASSVLKPDGKLDAVLDVNGAAYSEFSRFRIDGNGLAEVGDVISLEWDPKVASRTTSICRFTFIDVMDFKSFVNGFNIGRNSGGGQVDCSYFEHCTVSGKWTPGNTTTFQNAFLVGSGTHGNNVCHTLTHPILAGCRYLVAGKGALPVTILGGSFGDAESVFLWQSSGPLTCIGGRAETCQRLYSDGGNVTGWDAVATVQNFIFNGNALHPDGNLVVWNTGGRLKLDGVQAAGVRSGALPRIQVGAWAGADVAIEGMLTPTPPDQLVSVLGQRQNVSVSRKGYRQIGADGTAKLAPDSDMRVPGNLVVAGSITGQSLDLGDGRKWDATGLFTAPDAYWTPDGFYPGPNRGIKWDGIGTLVAGPGEGFRFVGWSQDKLGKRRQGWIVPPLTKGK